MYDFWLPSRPPPAFSPPEPSVGDHSPAVSPTIFGLSRGPLSTWKSCDFTADSRLFRQFHLGARLSSRRGSRQEEPGWSDAQRAGKVRADVPTGAEARTWGKSDARTERDALLRVRGRAEARPSPSASIFENLRLGGPPGNRAPSGRDVSTKRTRTRRGHVPTRSRIGEFEATSWEMRHPAAWRGIGECCQYASVANTNSQFPMGTVRRDGLCGFVRGIPPDPAEGPLFTVRGAKRPNIFRRPRRSRGCGRCGCVSGKGRC